MSVPSRFLNVEDICNIFSGVQYVSSHRQTQATDKVISINEGRADKFHFNSCMCSFDIVNSYSVLVACSPALQGLQSKVNTTIDYQNLDSTSSVFAR